ncbi:MFS transporter [Glutamicibacter sp.]|uniref:MFS transporter n=1 Tax=Glutamicibacter sp. TaxID=1931995 RepID=UPI0028BE31D4|nr:MFS transporter [Glutamicibacter sp.]
MTQAVKSYTREKMSEKQSLNIIFFIAGLSFASWAGRLSVIDAIFDFSGLTLGTFLLCMTTGTLFGISIIPTISRKVNTKNLLLFLPLLLSACLIALGFAISITKDPTTAYIILFINGVFFGCLDIMMNVSGARVERHLNRSIMPIFHGFFSLGTLVGAGIATATISVHMFTIWHFTLVALIIVFLTMLSQRGLRGWENENYNKDKSQLSTPTNSDSQKLGALLLIGLMVAGLSFAEGSANDWIAVAAVSGHGLPHQAGALMFTLFVAAMTIGRFTGGRMIDSMGPKRTLMIMGTIGLAGICLFILGDGPFILGVSAVMWGLGSSLGFPVGMTIAASQSSRLGPNAVSIISAFGYGAMLAGPPLIGFIVDHVGLPNALWLAAAVMATSLMLTPRVARNSHRSPQKI